MATSAAHQHLQHVVPVIAISHGNAHKAHEESRYNFGQAPASFLYPIQAASNTPSARGRRTVGGLGKSFLCAATIGHSRHCEFLMVKDFLPRSAEWSPGWLLSINHLSLPHIEPTSAPILGLSWLTVAGMPVLDDHPRALPTAIYPMLVTSRSRSSPCYSPCQHRNSSDAILPSYASSVL